MSKLTAAANVRKVVDHYYSIAFRPDAPYFGGVEVELPHTDFTGQQRPAQISCPSFKGTVAETAAFAKALLQACAIVREAEGVEPEPTEAEPTWAELLPDLAATLVDDMRVIQQRIRRDERVGLLTLEGKLATLPPGGEVEVSRNGEMWVTAERTGDGKTLKFVRHTPDTSTVFHTTTF